MTVVLMIQHRALSCELQIKRISSWHEIAKLEFTPGGGSSTTTYLNVERYIINRAGRVKGIGKQTRLGNS